MWDHPTIHPPFAGVAPRVLLQLLVRQLEQEGILVEGSAAIVDERSEKVHEHADPATFMGVCPPGAGGWGQAYRRMDIKVGRGWVLV